VPYPYALPVCGARPFAVSFKDPAAMPPEYSRGATARTYLYMSERYDLRLSRQDKRLYEIWNRQYPISEWEHWRNRRIACVQGNANPHVGAVDQRSSGPRKSLASR